MAKSFFETIIASGGFAGEHYDVAVGPVLDGVLTGSALNAGDGILGEDAPLNIISTGALGGSRELDLSGAENSDGRIIFLSVRNSDITINNLTLVATTSVNGFGPTTGLVISNQTDYWLVHETGGVWRAYEQRLNFGTVATIYRATFTAADWSAGVNNQITVIRTGSPAAGEIGPHNLADADSYVIQVYRDSDDELVDVGVISDSVTGNITITKTGLGAAFDGRVIIIGD